MLLRWRTPPGTSEVLDDPDRRRRTVVSLLPNAMRNWNGNSSRSNGWLASSDTASSISTAFIELYNHPSADRRGGRAVRHRRTELMQALHSESLADFLDLGTSRRKVSCHFCCNQRADHFVHQLVERR